MTCGEGIAVSVVDSLLYCPFQIQSAACVLWPTATLLNAKSLINDGNFFRETKSFLVNSQVYKLKNITVFIFISLRQRMFYSTFKILKTFTTVAKTLFSAYFYTKTKQMKKQ